MIDFTQASPIPRAVRPWPREIAAKCLPISIFFAFAASGSAATFRHGEIGETISPFDDQTGRSNNE
jgi:hypothetical protein